MTFLPEDNLSAGVVFKVINRKRRIKYNNNICKKQF